MHELGILFHVADTVIAFAKKNNVTKVDTLVLQIGELSPVVPKYIEDCFPVAVDGTMLQDTKLKIEIMPGNAVCKQCGKVFSVIQTRKTCPVCQSRDCDITSGQEFMIKEIVAM